MDGRLLRRRLVVVGPRFLVVVGLRVVLVGLGRRLVVELGQRVGLLLTHGGRGAVGYPRPT